MLVEFYSRISSESRNRGFCDAHSSRPSPTNHSILLYPQTPCSNIQCYSDIKCKKFHLSTKRISQILSYEFKSLPSAYFANTSFFRATGKRFNDFTINFIIRKSSIKMRKKSQIPNGEDCSLEFELNQTLCPETLHS